jgi:cyanate permease
MWAVVKAAYAEYTALGLVMLPLLAMGTMFLVVGKIFDHFGGKVAAVVASIMVLVAAVLMFKAALDPKNAALSFGAMIAVGAAVGAVGATLIKRSPKAEGNDITADYEAYLAEAEGANASFTGLTGGGGASAQTLIVDRATFRSDNLSEVDYDSIMRT